MAEVPPQRCKRILQTHEIINDLDKIIPPRESLVMVDILATEVWVAILHNLLVWPVGLIWKLEFFSFAVVDQYHQVILIKHYVVQLDVLVDEASRV